MTIALHSPADWQAGFQSVLPAIQIHAQIQFRKLPLVHREEAVQEAIAAACVSYRLLAIRNKLHVAHPSTLANYAVKHVRSGRHVGGHQDAARDVMSPVVHRRQHVKLFSYDVRRSQRDGNDWKRLVIADRKHPIPDTVAFRIDFDVWLRTLARRDRRIISAFVGGDRATTVADRYGISEARISQLRRRYERSWHIFQRNEAHATAGRRFPSNRSTSKEVRCNTSINAGCREST